MTLGYKEYLETLYSRIPEPVYEGVGSIFVIGVVLILSFIGMKGWRYVSGLLLGEFVFLIYASTVIFRESSEDSNSHFTPFWSYRNCFHDGEFYLNTEVALNIFVFLPVGFMLASTFKGLDWWKTLLIGCGISVSIEILQYFLKRGFPEFDDVFSNTIGCLIGLVAYKMIEYATRRAGRQSL